MENIVRHHWLNKLLICFTLLLSMQSAIVQAGMIKTNSVIEYDDKSYTKLDLQTALQSKQLQKQLALKGVDAKQLQDRIASLTPDEISRLNTELENQPAGGEIFGVFLVIFVIFMITDMLCATDVFTFVKCINTRR